jgi:hypothetical protein
MTKEARMSTAATPITPRIDRLLIALGVGGKGAVSLRGKEARIRPVNE